LPMVDVQSVGAGGGSLARVRQGALLVGPESAGSVPGPACYGRGGTQPSVTDADAVLGYLPVDGFAGGRMHLDVAAARTAINEHVAKLLGIEVTEAAWGIERIVNANMANATRKVLAGHGADPRELALIAFGGNGAVHAGAIARELGVARIIVPKAAPAFSALGVLVADYVVDLVRSYVTPLSQVDLGRVHDFLTDLLQEVDKELDPTGVAPADVERSLYAQMCYPGQNFDMSVPVPEGVALDEPGLLDLAERFHDQHLAERGFCFRSQQPLMRGVRVIARGNTPKPDHLAETGALADASQARSGTRPAFWGDGFVDTPIYDGTRLGEGATVDGPALIEEPYTVVVLPPDATATLDGLGNYVISV
jgi:N-methylhydantoinase A